MTLGAEYMPALGSPGGFDPQGRELPEFSMPLWWDADSDGSVAAAPSVDFTKPPPSEPQYEPAPERGTFGPPAPPAPGDPAGAVPAYPDQNGSLGWDFEQPEHDPFVWEDNPRRRPMWVPVAIGVLFLALAIVAALIMTREEEKPEPPPPPPPAPVAATPISPEQLAQYQPQQVVVLPFEGRLQVTWQPPATTQGIYGYMVITQTPAGQPVSPSPVLVKPDERFAVFTGQAAVPGTCAVVTTLVSGQPSMMLAKGDAVCPGASPAASAPPSSPSAPGTAPRSP
ncbi:hypothetical protein [Yinghuangia sp. YIM S10712]|uniref:hypothetical protein n=1 Tax=Yinghuangia sp. YIM S10712 TaxID=3436930 RepID=UPI003F52C155